MRVTVLVTTTWAPMEDRVQTEAEGAILVVDHQTLAAHMAEATAVMLRIQDQGAKSASRRDISRVSAGTDSMTHMSRTKGMQHQASLHMVLTQAGIFNSPCVRSIRTRITSMEPTVQV
jgi:hypothetical protein